MKTTFHITLGCLMLAAQLVFAQPAAPVTAAGTSAPEGVVSNTAVATAVVPAPPRPNPAIIPQLNRQYMRAHSNYVEIAKQGGIDLLFMGDSITDWWRNPGRGGGTNGIATMGGRAVFDKYFGAMKVANFGIAGDTTQGVLWRLENGEGEGYKPKAIMLMIGTNNTGGNSAPEITMGVANIVFDLRKRFPEAKILLLAIFPRDRANAPVRAKIGEINKMIAALHDNRQVFFMDIGPLFLAEDGSIPRDIMSDGLHPTSKGYEIWAEAVKDKLAAMMQ